MLMSWFCFALHLPLIPPFVEILLISLSKISFFGGDTVSVGIESCEIVFL